MAGNGRYSEYVERMAQVRTLSSPELLDLDDAEDYAHRLRENFQAIGRLANVNHELLDERLYPLLNSPDPLTDEQAEALSELSDGLLNVGGLEEYENLDLPIAAMVSERLMGDATTRGDLAARIRQLDTMLTTCYSLMNMTGRIVTRPEICEGFRQQGLDAGVTFLEMLEPERFRAIEDEGLRDLVLTNARFSTAFYEHVRDDPAANAALLGTLDRMWELSFDPFYHEAVPDFDWNYFRFRVLEYTLHCSEMLNDCGFSAEQLAHIADAADEMERLIASDPAYFEGIIGEAAVPVICARSRYVAGRISREEYRAVLQREYARRDVRDFGSNGCDTNIMIPLEMLCLVSDATGGAAGASGAAGADGAAAQAGGAAGADGAAGAGGAGVTAAEGGLPEEDAELLSMLYHELGAYIFRMPNVGSLSFVLEYYAEIVERFRDVPCAATFEEFVLQLLAALHPPTYVHSRMVAKISQCLFSHLVDLMPEQAVGLLGCESELEVVARRDELTSFAYHAALCHDFGKISIIDTIFMYGRRLLDFEFEIIQAHPVMGARLLREHEATRGFADIALCHHVWYDDSRGYPAGVTTADSPLRALINLVACADCMDAATDSIGRTYKHGKTLDDYIDELREGAGTRYAPWLVGLVEHPDVYHDLERLLDEGRRQTYRDTYALLRAMTDRG